MSTWSPRCLWCGGGHRHQEFPEKGHSTSLQKSCNCESQNPSKYLGCSCDKEFQRGKKMRNNLPSGTFWSPFYFQNCFSRHIPCRRNCSNWHHRQKNAAKKALDKCSNDYMTTLITTVQQIMTGLEKRTGLLSLWKQFMETRVPISPIRSCSTVSTPILVWSLIP
jgi:hypothetical protein